MGKPRKQESRGLTPLSPTVAAMVRERLNVSWSRARNLCTDGRVSVDGERCLDPAARIRADAAIVINETAPKLEKGPLHKSAIVYSDSDLVVVEKPAGMLSVADEEGNNETLVDYTRNLLRRMRAGADAPLGVVHRLDRDTSGLMVFARTTQAKAKLAAMFKAHDIERIYHAIAHGTVPAKKVESDLLLDRGDGLRGSFGHFRRAKGGPPAEARHSITHFEPIVPLEDATLVECRLETGRQHQIRIHLAEMGHPVVGERVYIRDYTGEKIEADRVMLHARELGFAHPRSGEAMSFTREPPKDFEAMVRSLRR
jgi:23S rRNA pseudouridine1911/1915/1917 synthase